MSGHTPAFPIPLNDGASYKGHAPCDGLTKRELFAAMAMQGYIASGHAPPAEKVAEWSVYDADALLAELAKGGAK